jgi:hypothetical protein
MNKISSAKKLIFQTHPAMFGSRVKKPGSMPDDVAKIVTLGESIVGYI